MTIGLIGGSGLAQGLEGTLTNVHRRLAVPQYGDTFSYYDGERHGRRVIIVPRHGAPGDRQRSPAQLSTEDGYKGIVWFLHEQGVTEAYGFSAVGCIDRHRWLFLRVPLASEGSFIIPRTYGRGPGGVSHSFGFDVENPFSNMSTPFDPTLRAALADATRAAGYKAIENGISIYTGGDAFETPEEVRAAARIFPRPKPRILTMTQVPEAQLFAQVRQADTGKVGIPYAVLCSNVNYAEGVSRKTPVSHAQTLHVMEVANGMVVEITDKLLEART